MTNIRYALKSDLAVFWAKIPPSSDWFYNIKTQKPHFLQNRSTKKAKIENMNYTICLQLISSSGQIVLPPAFARLEQRGVHFSHLEKSESYPYFTLFSREKKWNQVWGIISPLSLFPIVFPKIVKSQVSISLKILA